MNIPHYKFIQFFVFMLFLVIASYFLELLANKSSWSILHTIGLALYGILVIVITVKGKKYIYTKEFGYISKIKENLKPKTIIEKLKAMHPKDFEDFIQLLFELREYNIVYKSFWKKNFGKRIPGKDGGIDLIALKDNKKTYIQIKKYIANMVGVETMRAFYGSIVNKIGSKDSAIFITTSIFSEDAMNFAKENNIKIMSYKEIEEGILLIEKIVDSKNKIEAFLSQIDYYENSQYNQNIRTCRQCGAPLKWRNQGFYGCQNYSKTGCSYKEYK